MLTQLKAWLWLTQALEPGPAWQVLRHFGAPEQAYFADGAEYALIPALRPEHRRALADKSLDRAELILADCDRAGVSILTWQDTEYPERLRNIDLPPLVLYYKGSLPRFDEEIAIAMAGTRHASPYGRKVAAELGFQITRLGGLVLTGIVAGCDQCAAEGALKAGGPLVCVLAGGVDLPYYDNDNSRHLLADVAACGTLISECPPGTPHLGPHFLARNRILTGLSLGVVCVEAPERSGTLNVARLAMEQGRDVFAVPANIDAPAGAGTNRLLTQGALCVCSGADVLDSYWAIYPKRRKAPSPLSDGAQAERLKTVSRSDDTPAKPIESAGEPPRRPEKKQIRLSEHKSEYTDDEQAVLRALQNGPLVTDAIVAATGLPARRVSATLTVLTIRGLVSQLPGGRFDAAVEII